eukprot:364570-Chlamydomonas_euryale.AAC.7
MTEKETVDAAMSSCQGHAHEPSGWLTHDHATRHLGCARRPGLEPDDGQTTARAGNAHMP